MVDLLKPDSVAEIDKKGVSHVSLMQVMISMSSVNEFFAG